MHSIYLHFGVPISGQQLRPEASCSAKTEAELSSVVYNAMTAAVT